MSWNFVRFQKNINLVFAENFKKIGRKSKKAQPNELIGLFVYFPSPLTNFVKFEQICYKFSWCL